MLSARWACAPSNRQQRIAAGEQPAWRAALPPPRPEQLEQLRREHRVPVLAALALLDADQHALGVDIADAQHHHLAGSQACAVGDAQRRLVLEAWTGCRFQKTAHLLGRQHARQLPGVVHASEMAGELGTVQRSWACLANSASISG